MRTTLLTLVAIGAVVAAIVASTTTAAAATAPRPDAHDRALASQLAEKAVTFQTLASKTSGGNELQKTLEGCAFIKKNPKQAFAAVFALVPVLLIDVVNQYKPQLTDLRDTLAKMRPHALVFRQWAAAEAQSFSLMLRFDNHGKKIDLCKAATVLLDKKSTTGDVRNVLGIDPALIATLFQSGSTKASATLKRLNPQMRSFFIAAGLSPKIAKSLTT